MKYSTIDTQLTAHNGVKTRIVDAKTYDIRYDSLVTVFKIEQTMANNTFVRYLISSADYLNVSLQDFVGDPTYRDSMESVDALLIDTIDYTDSLMLATRLLQESSSLLVAALGDLDFLQYIRLTTLKMNAAYASLAGNTKYYEWVWPTWLSNEMWQLVFDSCFATDAERYRFSDIDHLYVYR